MKRGVKQGLMRGAKLDAVKRPGAVKKLGAVKRPGAVRGPGAKRLLVAAVLAKFVREQRGSVTAEFALTIPVVLLVLGIAVGSIFLAAERVSLVSLAGEVARLEARGDTALASARLAENPSAVIQRTNDGRILCVTAVSRPGPGLLAAVTVSGRGCAAVTWVEEK